MYAARIALALAAVLLVAAVGKPAPEIYRLPEWMPPPPRSDGNPPSAAKIELGRHLFYDTRLSLDGSMSCDTCHVQSLAFTDGQAVHAGVHGDDGVRNVPSLANLAYMPTLNWGNPGLREVERQVLIPLFGDNPVEMGMQGKERELFATLSADPVYRELAQQAFPASGGEWDMEVLTRSLAAFVSNIISFDSPYDRYKRLGEEDAISAAAKRGEDLFFSERLECSHCHGGANFTDNFQTSMMPFPETGFHNTGLYNLDGKGAYPKANPGAREVTGRDADEGKFRSPSLRNVAVTAPYMHDGSIATLEEVIRDHYTIGGRAAGGPNGASPLRDPLLTGFTISDREVADLVAFLESLTDEGLLTDPAYAPPAH
ncbi:cytochrome c peroxidase [Altererythrobacter atlanticus]|uniref:Cytochrome c551 peroxidase n=1 Tax=Croceibacterium atlanticum TaxID=1267766 RepID=A0A0F7KUX0_9SPHN|nr:methanobactin export MATE transporter MbnM [Croceibacterium atlanticum]AKH43429.1 Cytochrome c551 peroxidase precursor [Croceibacterium atlanticum]MBB5731863.1 cytochrome c peroxidase [Croceibacterium atlanticum]